LAEIVCQIGIVAGDIQRLPPARSSLVVLRSGGEDRDELPYEQTDETALWVEVLDRYNHFIEQHDVRLELTPEEKILYLKAEYEGRSSRDWQPKLSEPEFFNRHFYRIFNDGTWEHGGRLYRAWWQNVPSPLRRKITINGEATAELDYSGFLPRSIYHLSGINYPADDDPYVLPELTAYALELGKPEDYFRKSTKTLLVALLNGDGELSHPERAKLKVGFLPRYSRADVECLIAKKHPLLRDFFRTGEGKRNQRLDSDIALDVTSVLMGKGILVLAIHDSFVVQQKDTTKLRELMVSTYKNRLGYEPIIKQAF
jgi:hypothetical protein